MQSIREKELRWFYDYFLGRTKGQSLKRYGIRFPILFVANMTKQKPIVTENG